MRKTCTKLQVRQDTKHLTYLNKSCCSQIEYVLRRYEYSSRADDQSRIVYSLKKLKDTTNEKYRKRRERLRREV